MTTPVVASDVRKEFGTDGIVQGADLEVEEGEVLVLMGPNGVGKTVFLSCLAGSERPTEGSIELFGRPAERDDGGNLAFMLQDTMAVETLSGRENAAFYGRLHDGFTDRWREYVDDLGIEDDLDKLVKHYSEGMVRKLEFALTMSVDVPLYLLDEPTAGVDLTMIQRFHDVILTHNADGATFVISSHRPMDADLADRIAFMPDGTISTVGRPEDLVDTLPPVVRVTGTGAMHAAEEFVVDEQLFPLGSEARGFLREGVTLADVEAALDDAGETVERIEPTYTDLFNYYVHVAGEGRE